MDASKREKYVNNLHDEIREACDRLEKRGYDCMVVITSKDRHMELGSTKARNFVEDFPDYFEDFIHYCQVKRKKQVSDMEEGHDESSESQSTVSAASQVSAVIVTPQRKAVKTEKIDTRKEFSDTSKTENKDSKKEESDLSKASSKKKKTQKAEVPKSGSVNVNDNESGTQQEENIDEDQENASLTSEPPTKVARRSSRLNKGKQSQT